MNRSSHESVESTPLPSAAQGLLFDDDLPVLTGDGGRQRAGRTDQRRDAAGDAQSLQPRAHQAVRTRDEVLTMLATSAVLPLAAVRGLVRGVADLPARRRDVQRAPLGVPNGCTETKKAAQKTTSSPAPWPPATSASPCCRTCSTRWPSAPMERATIRARGAHPWGLPRGPSLGQ